MAKGTSALRVSRIGLPLSHVSTRANSSKLASIISATLLSNAALVAAGVLPHASFAALAASTAF